MQAELKVGDIVHVRVKVVSVNKVSKSFTGEATTSGEVNGPRLPYKNSRVVKVEERPLGVGDEVDVGMGRGKIVAVQEQFAWLEFKHPTRETTYLTYQLSNLKRTGE